jgi:hypothetical protein
VPAIWTVHEGNLPLFRGALEFLRRAFVSEQKICQRRICRKITQMIADSKDIYANQSTSDKKKCRNLDARSTGVEASVQ